MAQISRMALSCFATTGIKNLRNLRDLRENKRNLFVLKQESAQEHQ